MTFLPFLLNQSRLQICSCKFFLFWPVPLKSVKKRKKKSIYACILINKISKKKKKKKIFIHIFLKKNTIKTHLCRYIEKKNKKKKKKYNLFLFWPVTLQTLNGSSTVVVSTLRQESHWLGLLGTELDCSCGLKCLQC